MIDRKVAGIAIISVTLSGLLVFSFAEEASEDPVEILTNEYPGILPSGESTIAISMAARHSIERLDIKSKMLTSSSLSLDELIDPYMEFNQSNTPYDVFGNVKRLEWYREELNDLGIEPRTINSTLNIEGSEFQMACIDYTDVIRYLLGVEAMENIPLAYAVAMNGTGDYIWLEGGNEFFVRPTTNIKRLTYSNNENQTTYVPDDQLWEGSDQLPISEAPRGLLSFNSLDKDDTINIITTFEGRSVPSDPKSPIAILQIIDIYVDGEVQDPIINLIRK